MSRVIDVFGQEPEQSLLTPFTYEWSKNPDPRQDWEQFKLLIDGDRYLTDHPSAETTVIQCASKGLAKTSKGDKALDQIRVELGTRPENWKEFKNVVDKFLGDRFKDEFDQKMMNDPIPILTSEILGMRKQISVENINKVTNLKTKINQYPELKLNTGKKIEKNRRKF